MSAFLTRLGLQRPRPCQQGLRLERIHKSGARHVHDRERHVKCRLSSTAFSRHIPLQSANSLNLQPNSLQTLSTPFEKGNQAVHLAPEQVSSQPSRMLCNTPAWQRSPADVKLACWLSCLMRANTRAVDGSECSVECGVEESRGESR